MATYIYYFPRHISNLDNDDCSDFFEYILTRMEKIISKYELMSYKFLTWFTLVLRRHFTNWIKIKSKKIIEYTILNNPINRETKEEIISQISNEIFKTDKPDERILKILNGLPPKIKIVLKLHYFDFFQKEDIFEIKLHFGGEIIDLLKKYHELKDRVIDKSKKILSLQEKIGKTYRKMISLYEEKDDYELNNSINKLKEKHKTNLEILKKTYNSLKNIDIAELLGITPKQIANLIFRGKNLLKNELGNIL